MIIIFESEHEHAFCGCAFSLIWNEQGEVRIFHEPGTPEDTGQVLASVRDGKAARLAVQILYNEIVSQGRGTGRAANIISIKVLELLGEFPFLWPDDSPENG